MFKIEKKKKTFANNETYHTFYITTDEGQFYINYAPNWDLYWNYVYEGYSNDLPKEKSFIITKENYYFYSLIEKLYNDIKNCNVFRVNNIEKFFCNSVEELLILKEKR